MPLILRTRKDDPLSHELAEIGVLTAQGRGGIVLDDRAVSQMSEFQKPDGTPLTGAKLKEAATDFANRRGFVLQDASKEVAAGLSAEVSHPATNDLAAVVEADRVKREHELSAVVDPEEARELEAAVADESAGADVEPPEEGAETVAGESDGEKTTTRSRRSKNG